MGLRPRHCRTCRVSITDFLSSPQQFHDLNDLRSPDCVLGTVPNTDPVPEFCVACLGEHPSGPDYCPCWSRFNQDPSTPRNDIPLLPPTPTLSPTTQPTPCYATPSFTSRYYSRFKDQIFQWSTNYTRRFRFWEAAVYPRTIYVGGSPAEDPKDGAVYGFGFGDPELDYIDTVLRNHLACLEEAEAWKEANKKASFATTIKKRVFKEYEPRPRSKKGTNAGPLSKKVKTEAQKALSDTDEPSDHTRRTQPVGIRRRST